MKKTMTFEHAMARLEEIADLLENGKTSLDETMAIFEEANELFHFCSERLRQAEKKLYILVKKQESFQLESEENSGSTLV